MRLKLRRVTSFCNRALSTFAKRSLDPACEVVSDGLACFGAVADAGGSLASGRQDVSSVEAVFEFSKVSWHVLLIDRAVCSDNGRFDIPKCRPAQALRPRALPDLGAMMPRLTWAGVRTTPMPYRLLKLACSATIWVRSSVNLDEN